MQFQLKELKNGLIPNENRSSRKWKSKRKIKFISGQFLLVLSKNDDALTKFLSKKCWELSAAAIHTVEIAEFYCHDFPAKIPSN